MKQNLRDREPARPEEESAPRYLTPRQLAARWAISPAKTYALLGTTLRCMRIGSCVRILVSDVIAYERTHLSAAP